MPPWLVTLALCAVALSSNKVVPPLAPATVPPLLITCALIASLLFWKMVCPSAGGGQGRGEIGEHRAAPHCSWKQTRSSRPTALATPLPWLLIVELAAVEVSLKNVEPPAWEPVTVAPLLWNVALSAVALLENWVKPPAGVRDAAPLFAKVAVPALAVRGKLRRAAGGVPRRSRAIVREGSGRRGGGVGQQDRSTAGPATVAPWLVKFPLAAVEVFENCVKPPLRRRSRRHC
ncbi:MAG: hypothetical protein WDN28_31470 [Chthoniobacter sp.]